MGSASIHPQPQQSSVKGSPKLAVELGIHQEWIQENNRKGSWLKTIVPFLVVLVAFSGLLHFGALWMNYAAFPVMVSRLRISASASGSSTPIALDNPVSSRVLVEDAIAHMVAETGLGARAEGKGLLATRIKIEEDERREVVETTALKQHEFVAYGPHGFVKFAGYRLGPAEIVAVGLGAVALAGHRKLGTCKWTTPSGDVVNGTMKVIHGTEHHDLEYQVIIISCLLERRTPFKVGGTLTMTVDSETFEVYHEEGSAVTETMPRGPYKHNISHCGPPLHDGLDWEKLKVWLDYHIRMGFDHFVMYDVGGITPESLEMLKPYMDLGMVEITPFHNIVKYESWYFGQVLIVNECAYRLRFDSQWVANLDYDEYIQVPGNRTLRDVLEEHQHQAFVQHGTVWWDTTKCVPAEGTDDPRWPMERMVFREPDIFCLLKRPPRNRKTCHDYFGHRKYFANPRRVSLLEVHKVVVPRKGGVSLSTDVMMHQHLRGLVTLGWGGCMEEHGLNEGVPGYVPDSSMADLFRELRENPIDFKVLGEEVKRWLDFVAASKSPNQRGLAP